MPRVGPIFFLNPRDQSLLVAYYNPHAPYLAVGEDSLTSQAGCKV